MATTDFGALSAARKILWAVKISIAGRDESFWMSTGLVGKNTDDMNRPVQRITELTETERGAQVVMQLVAELLSDGVVGDNMLEGNEESLVNEAITLNIDQLRHGVKNRGRMSEQRTVIRFRSQAREKLAYWLADTVDELMFLTASGRAYTLLTTGATRDPLSELPQLTFASDVTAPTTNRLVFAEDATTEASLVATDTMSWDFLLEVCAKAKRERLKPIREGGKKYYAVLMSTEQMRDLKKDQDFKDAVARGGDRGAKNPLFSGEVIKVDGLILYEHPKVYNTLGLTATNKWGVGGNVDGAQALMLGSQALGFATIGTPDYEESDNTDYKNRKGLSYGRIIGILKPQFKSRFTDNSLEDFGVINLKTAAAAS